MRTSVTLFVLVCAMATAAIVTGPAGAGGAQGCHPNDSLFAYTVNYADNARFIAADKNADALLCLKSNDPHYTGDPATLVVYDNNPKKA